MTTESTNLPRAVIQLVVAALGLCVVTIVLGKLTLSGPVKAIDEPLYEFLANAMQSVPGLVEFSKVATRLGAIPVNYGMAIGVACLVGFQRRGVFVPVLVLATLFGSHVFQEVVKSFVDGTLPPEEYIIGSAGPFFSGGVQRVIVMAGVVLTLAQLQPVNEPSPGSKFLCSRLVYQLSAAVGLFEAVTRMALGLHWPADLVAAFPIGLTIVWIFRAALLVVVSLEGQRQGADDNAVTS